MMTVFVELGEKGKNKFQLIFLAVWNNKEREEKP